MTETLSVCVCVFGPKWPIDKIGSKPICIKIKINRNNDKWCWRGKTETTMARRW